MPPFYCCDASPNEQLFGTTARAGVWLALEYREAFGSEALPESSIPDAVKEHLDGLPNSRVQLIRKPEAFRNGELVFFIALPHETNPVLYAFKLKSYDDLLQLDLSAIVSSDPGFDQNRSDKPLFLVCANGKRDIACAKFGPPVYDAIKALQNERVWQTTHLGGHRFAGTAIILPRGLSYGRLDAQSGAKLISEYESGRIVLENYRGAAYYDDVAQAAEYYLRAMTGKTEIGAYRFVDKQSVENEQWLLRFEDRGGRIHEIRLARDLSIDTYKNSTDTTPTVVRQFRLLDNAVKV